jgi:hypothetical protein
MIGGGSETLGYAAEASTRRAITETRVQGASWLELLALCKRQDDRQTLGADQEKSWPDH